MYFLKQNKSYRNKIKKDFANFVVDYNTTMPIYELA